MEYSRQSAKRRKSLSGAVLIMVITVMFVLIVMLLATLTVVSTAQNRAYTNYEENQAYYTARSALDVFTQNMLGDSGYYAYDSTGSVKKYDYTTVDMSKPAAEKSATTAKATANMKQGLAMEFELYKITAQNDAGYASNFTETDKIFGETVVISEDKNYSIASKPIDSITYSITFPVVQDSSGSEYGKFVDVDSTTTMQEATITVTVVSRRFNFGGANADAFSAMSDEDLKKCTDNGTVTVSINGTNTTFTDDQLMEAIRLGDRTKDKIRAKITSTVEFMDVEGTAVLYYDTSEKPAVNSSNAITSLNDISDGSGVFAVGGASSLNGGLRLVDNAVVAGSLYIHGDIDTSGNTSGRAYLYSDTLYAIRGNLTIASGGVILKFMGDGSVFYAEDTFTLNTSTSNNNMGDSTHRTNIIAPKFVVSGNTNMPTVYGNVYCDEYKVDVSTYNNENLVVTGDIYTNFMDLTSYADITNDTVKFNGKLIVNKINVSQGFILKDPLNDDKPARFVFNPVDNLISADGGDTTYELNLPADTTIRFSSSNKVNISYSDPTAYTLTSSMEKEFTLPSKLAGRTTDTISIPTDQSTYSKIYKETAFVKNSPDVGTNGNINMISYPTITLSTEDFSVFVDVNDYGWVHKVKMDIPANGMDIIAGKITNANKTLYGYGQYDSTFDNDKKAALAIYAEAEADARENNDGYKAALAAYYSNYITGAEKAGANTTTLLDYTDASSELKPMPIGDANINLSSYSAADQTAIKNLNATGVINSSGYLCSFTNYSQVYGTARAPIIIDATTNDIVIQLGSDNTTENVPGSGYLEFRGYFVVIGDKNVKFYLPDGRDYNLGDSGSGNTFAVYTYDILKALKTDKFLKLGEDSAATKSPNVYFYAGNEVENIKLNDPQDGFISAHVYAPFAHYEFGAGSGQIFDTIYYNGGVIIPTSPSSSAENGFSIVGSLICNSYKSGNKIGVAYINPETSSYVHGDPQFAWKTYQYARN